MELKDILGLIGGLALFLYGMNAMGAALEKSAGNKLKIFLSNATSNPFKGFLLGLIVTLIIQSSSATTVMVVGFVNSGIMTLGQSIGVILGANLGTSVTAWILSLQAIDPGNGGLVILQLLKPATFVPIVAFIGVLLFAFQKNAKRKDIGMILLGFAILMFGMEMMSDAVSGLKGNDAFKNILIMFSNPVLGVIVGTVFTAVIQSSSASVGVLQALTKTGAVSFATAFPIIMGQNIGTCVSALISSIGTSKNARRAAVIHLSFNVIATIIILPIFYLVDHFVNFTFMDMQMGYVSIAIVHTIFKLAALAIIAPFAKGLEKLARLVVRDGEESEENKLLDERFYTVPSVAIERSRTVAVTMAEVAVMSIRDSLKLLEGYSDKEADKVREAEGKVDMYEDKIGSYLVKLSSHDLTEADSNETNKLLHVIGDIERISDHAVNIVESAEEIHDKKLAFSEEASRELNTMVAAIDEILGLSLEALKNNDLRMAAQVEPLEQVVDQLRDTLKFNHVSRLSAGQCTIELGFVFGDILTNLERIADHCSNIAGCVLEMAKDEMDIHEYLRSVRGDKDGEFFKLYESFKDKYAVASAQK
ncbi:MAG: Na/Pi cotransporter family protein [Clostridia bacterium]|nr:Na/Pi cotransporter family protein [Clostridia bacterium]